MAQRWFWVGCLIEGALGLLAWLVGGWLGVDWGEQLELTPGRVGAGLAFTVPLLTFFGWAMHSSRRAWREIRELLERHLAPLLRHWSVGQMAALSLLAGVTEEALFRGALQAGLSPVLGPLGAGCLAAVVFGLGHAATPAYALAASLVGGLLGWEAWATGGLVAPILTHALYDLVALCYLRRTPLPSGPMDVL